MSRGNPALEIGHKFITSLQHFTWPSCITLNRLAFSIVLFCICYNQCSSCINIEGIFVQVFTFHSGQCCAIVIVSFCAAYHRYVCEGLSQDLIGEACVTLGRERLLGTARRSDNTRSSFSITGYLYLNEEIKPHPQEVRHVAL